MATISKKSKTAAAAKISKTSVKQWTVQRLLPFMLLIGGFLGLISATILTIEKIHLLKNPGVQLGCDLNPIIACGSVINTPQASAFGFPNPLIGIAGFFGLMIIGAGLLAGARFKRWFWLGLQAGVIFGIAFVTWLQYQSIFAINALCPYCMVVWSVMIPLFIYTTVYNIRENHLRLGGLWAKIGAFVSRNHVDVLLAWYLVVIGAIITHFWYYWSTLI